MLGLLTRARLPSATALQVRSRMRARHEVAAVVQKPLGSYKPLISQQPLVLVLGSNGGNKNVRSFWSSGRNTDDLNKSTSSDEDNEKSSESESSKESPSTSTLASSSGGSIFGGISSAPSPMKPNDEDERSPERNPISERGFGDNSNTLSNVRYPFPRQSDTPEEVKKELARQMLQQNLRTGDTYNPMDLVTGARLGERVVYREQRRTPRPARLIVTGQEIHFTNVWLLSRFISPMGRVMPRWRTGLSPKKQAKMKKAVRRARQMGLLPYLHRYSHGPLDQAVGEKKPNPLACPLESKKRVRGWGAGGPRI